MPHALRAVDFTDDALGCLKVIIGHDDELAEQVTAQVNRIRGHLTQVNPALERVRGPKVQHPAILGLLVKFGGPTGLRTAGKRRLTSAATPLAKRSYEKLVTDIHAAALDEQTVTVPGTNAAEVVLPKSAASLQCLLKERADLETKRVTMLEAHPLAAVLTSMPGVGVRTRARILLLVGDGSTFPTPGHLAAYAGPAPVTRRSGTSIRDEHPNNGGNKHLSSELCSCPRSRPFTTPPATPTTTAREPKPMSATPPSSASPADAPTSSTPCSDTEPFTNTRPPQPLGEDHRDTPREGLPPSGRDELCRRT